MTTIVHLAAFLAVFCLPSVAAAGTFNNKQEVLDHVNMQTAMALADAQQKLTCQPPEAMTVQPQDFWYAATDSFGYFVRIGCAIAGNRQLSSFFGYSIDESGYLLTTKGHDATFKNTVISYFYDIYSNQFIFTSPTSLLIVQFYDMGSGSLMMDANIYEGNSASCHDHLEIDGLPDVSAWGTMSCLTQNMAYFYLHASASVLDIDYKGFSAKLDFSNFAFGRFTPDSVFAFDLHDGGMNHLQMEQAAAELKQGYLSNLARAETEARAQILCNAPQTFISDEHVHYGTLYWPYSEITYGCGKYNSFNEAVFEGSYQNFSIDPNQGQMTRRGEIFIRNGSRYTFEKDNWGFMTFNSPAGMMMSSIDPDLHGDFSQAWFRFNDQQGDLYCADTLFTFSATGQPLISKTDPNDPLPNCMDMGFVIWDYAHRRLEIYFDSASLSFDYTNMQSIETHISI